MRPLIPLLAFALLASTADAQRFRRFRINTQPAPRAQAAPPKVEPKAKAKKPLMEVDENEVKRWGNVVQRVGPGVWSDAGTDTFGVAMSTPASERHKWFISVVVDDTPQSKRLQQLFASNLDLRVWANPGDPSQSWSHYKEYRITDKSQAFRFKKIALQGYPTILIQPPLNQQFGNPHTVVGQILCPDGDCKKISKNIRASIAQYIKAQQGTFSHQRPAKKPAPKSKKPAWSAKSSKPKAEPKTKPRRGGWGQLDAPVPEGAFAQEPVERRRPFQPGPAPFDPNGPIRPNIVPNILPNVIPAQVLPPSNDPPAEEPDEEPDESQYAESPEAIIISDSSIGISEVNERRIRSMINGWKKNRFEKLRTRHMDFDDAFLKDIPVRKEDLPTVVLTNRRRIIDKITQGLLPDVRTEPLPTPGLTDIPWQAILSVFMGGGGFIQLALWGVRWFRRRRKRQGKQPFISDELFDLAMDNVPALIEKFGPMFKDFLAKSKQTDAKPEDK